MKNNLVILWILSLAVTCLLTAQPVKIAIVGNSITQGIGTSNAARDSYPAQLGLYLGDGYEVGNFGVSGRTMLKKGDFPIWAEPLFQDALAFDPDTLIILLGTNDCKPQNWDLYGDEFDDDYLAMIDTFSMGEKVPDIWACLPPPAFAVAFSINDTVIFNEVIPAIEQVIAARNLKKVDFYTPLTGRNELFPDNIHPNVTGANLMAKMLYEVMTGKTIPQKPDVNVVKNKPVQTDGGEDGNALNDGDPLTAWRITALPAAAVIDIGAPDSVDAFAVIFPNSAEMGIQYTIEGSLDGETWTPLVDNTETAETAQMASTRLIQPDAFQYFRLTVTGANSENEIWINEFQVLAYHGDHHANVLSALLDSQTAKFAYYYIYSISFEYPDELSKTFRDSWDDLGFLQMNGYTRVEDTRAPRSVLKTGGTQSFYGMTYLNGIEVISETITITNSETHVGHAEMPQRILLHSNYPNPFNPETCISYTLDKPARVRLTVYNSMGQQVRVLIQETEAAGTHQAYFNAEELESGVYIYSLQAGRTRLHRKMLLMK